MLDAIITGAGGFLGGALAKRLVGQGQAVLALARQNGDITEAAAWEALPAARTVFHLAGRSYVPDSWERPAQFMHANVVGTQRALDYCRRHNAALVLASAYVYGIPKSLPISEAHAARPNNPYALSKKMAEELCEFAAEFQRVPVTVLRLFNIYGRGQRPEFLIPIILDQVEKREPIRVLDLLPRRDYVYVEDVLDAFISAQNHAAGFRRINIASGESLSVGEIIGIIQSEAGTDLPVVSAGQERRQEIPDVRADIALARQLLQWSPRYNFRDGIRHMLAA